MTLASKKAKMVLATQLARNGDVHTNDLHKTMAGLVEDKQAHVNYILDLLETVLQTGVNFSNMFEDLTEERTVDKIICRWGFCLDSHDPRRWTCFTGGSGFTFDLTGQKHMRFEKIIGAEQALIRTIGVRIKKAKEEIAAADVVLATAKQALHEITRA